jgi:hypothetical protein
MIAHLLTLLARVRADLGLAALPVEPRTRFAEALDSMGLVELLARLADDCGSTPAALERAAGHTFSTVADLATALVAAGGVGRAVAGRRAGRVGRRCARRAVGRRRQRHERRRCSCRAAG